MSYPATPPDRASPRTATMQIALISIPPSFALYVQDYSIPSFTDQWRINTYAGLLWTPYPLLPMHLKTSAIVLLLYNHLGPLTAGRAPTLSSPLPATPANPDTLAASLPLPKPHRSPGLHQQYTAAQRRRSRHLYDRFALREEAMSEEEPLFMATDAEVTGAAPAHLQAAFLADEASFGRASLGAEAIAAAGGLRGLLHGRRRAFKYAKCNKCTIITCSKEPFICTGHCKKQSRLFTCRTTSRFATVRECPDDPPDPRTLPAEPLGRFDAAVVTATATFIGCANITNRPSGCPVTGTTATTASGRRAVVSASTCMQHLYPPDCGSPFFPFGYCECTLAVVGTTGEMVVPCNASGLQLGDGDGTGGNVTTALSQVAVVQLDNVTYTGFSDYTEEGDDPGYSYNHTFSVAGEGVLMTLDLFFGMTVEAEGFVTSGTVDRDYSYDYENAAETGVNDGAVAAVSMAQNPVSACLEEFRARNDGVFEDVEGDYYSVHYDRGYSGCFGNAEYRAPTFEVTILEDNTSDDDAE